MKRLNDFRIYYNHTIHPELLRLEKRRIRLLLLLAFSVVALIGVFILEFYIGVLAITLTLMIPIAFFIGYLIYRVRRFIQTFKPHVVNLLLDFIDDGPNYGTLSYQADKTLSKDKFLASHIFKTKANYFQGEDYIQGTVGSVAFEMSEIDVREESPVSSGLNPVFRGVFMHAKFNEPLNGVVLVWPRKYRQRLVGTIKEANFKGAKNVDHEILHEPFRERFMTYAAEDTNVAGDNGGLLPITMQQSIMEYLEGIQQRESKRHLEENMSPPQDREFFMSIINNNIYVAFTEEKDLLEPFIFKSNLSFELVLEFFEDINLLLRIIEDFDLTH